MVDQDRGGHEMEENVYRKKRDKRNVNKKDKEQKMRGWVEREEAHRKKKRTRGQGREH
jgi:hypothetical protein